MNDPGKSLMPRNWLTTELVGVLFFLGIVLMEVNNAEGRCFYVAENGNDSNLGTSAESAWRTTAKINTAKLKPGDQILFHRGDVFRGQLEIRDSGKPGHPIVIGAYGVGAKPVL
ncbi:MAG: right-handed parallel beta-helix repeat-containing protein, partial [Verrucomicrobiota bacterium]